MSITIARVAEMLGEDEEWLWEVANEMDAEDGLICRVYGAGDDGIMAFTDFGIETLTGIINMRIPMMADGTFRLKPSIDGKRGKSAGGAHFRACADAASTVLVRACPQLAILRSSHVRILKHW